MAFVILGTIVAVFIRSFTDRFGQTISSEKATEGTKENYKETTVKGRSGTIGARVIQLTCVAIIVPAIIILGLEGTIKGETVATLIGGLVGYALSGLGDFDGKRK